MSEELEQQVSDVGTEGSSDSQDKPAETSSESKEAPAEKYVPYDRFQEIIQQKNEFSKRLEEQEKRYKDLEERISRPVEAKPKENALIERLKGIDPEFGTWAAQQEIVAKRLEEMESRHKAAEQQRYIESASAVVDRLKNELKVDPALHGLYISKIKMGTSIKDIESQYKAEHDAISKFVEAQKKSALSQYSTDKKKDAVPASPKGSAPKASGTTPKFSGDREAALSQVVKRALNLRQG